MLLSDTSIAGIPIVEELSGGCHGGLSHHQLENNHQRREAIIS